MCRRPETAHQLVAYTGPGNHGETVALLGPVARCLRGLLPNVHLSSHTAGVVGNERRRLTDAIEAELKRFLQGEKLQHATRLGDLELMG